MLKAIGSAVSYCSAVLRNICKCISCRNPPLGACVFMVHTDSRPTQFLWTPARMRDEESESVVVVYGCRAGTNVHCYIIKQQRQPAYLVRFIIGNWWVWVSIDKTLQW